MNLEILMLNKTMNKLRNILLKQQVRATLEGMCNLARLTDRGLGVKKDHNLALKLLEQAAAQPPEHPIFKGSPNVWCSRS